ncbi:MAG: hypothetical protein COV35_01235 [Alphaproteobacteria bacterium CG11_big_fil_rev_8_21_14_0_20_39_49]|nr:MAG: hypothetical protein COV35_01235 [Alphaproteobacteria bacterium CG11_big_fil_rev_8_21_14_0_20_39_49]
MKLSALVFTPLALASFVTHNTQPSRSSFGIKKHGFVDRVSQNTKPAKKLFYSNDGNNDDLNSVNDNDFRPKEKYPPAILYNNFLRRNWGALKQNYQDGANPDMVLKNGNTLAHLVSGLPLGSLLTSAYNNSVDTLTRLSESGYDFSIKDPNGCTAKQVAENTGNNELALKIKKLSDQQMKIPPEIKEVNRRLYTIALQENPTKIARTMAANYLKAGANVDEGTPYKNIRLQDKGGNRQDDDSISDFRFKKTTIMDEVYKNWDKESVNAFNKLQNIAEKNAKISFDHNLLKQMHIDDNNKFDEMNKEWNNAVNEFVALEKPRQEEPSEKRGRRIV